MLIPPNVALLVDVTPDGSTFPGFGHMHSLPKLRKWYNQFTSSTPLSDNEIAGKYLLSVNFAFVFMTGFLSTCNQFGIEKAGGAWQRRTPHAVINVLRAEQLEAAEGVRESGILYERNIRVLVGREEGIGSEILEQELTREQSL